MHESDFYSENCFGTLTYDRAHLPVHGSLLRGDFQKFVKRLRKSLEPKKVRYFHAGEYGDRNGRPHYHFLLFGHEFRDRVQIREEPFPLYRSAELEALWGLGLSSVGDLSFASAAYVARYVMKKVDQVGRKPRFNVDAESGEMVEIEREYATMSRGGAGGHGLGFSWYEKFGREAHEHDSIVHDGQVLPVPRYYDNLLAERDEYRSAEVKAWRLHRFQERVGKTTVRSRPAREAMAKAKLELREREL